MSVRRVLVSNSIKSYLQACVALCTLLCCVSQVLHLLQTEGKTLLCQKDYNLLYYGLELNPQYL